MRVEMPVRQSKLMFWTATPLAKPRRRAFRRSLIRMAFSMVFSWMKLVLVRECHCVVFSWCSLVYLWSFPVRNCYCWLSFFLAFRQNIAFVRNLQGNTRSFILPLRTLELHLLRFCKDLSMQLTNMLFTCILHIHVMYMFLFWVK